MAHSGNDSHASARPVGRSDDTGSQLATVMSARCFGIPRGRAGLGFSWRLPFRGAHVPTRGPAAIRRTSRRQWGFTDWQCQGAMLWTIGLPMGYRPSFVTGTPASSFDHWIVGLRIDDSLQLHNCILLCLWTLSLCESESASNLSARVLWSRGGPPRMTL